MIAPKILSDLSKAGQFRARSPYSVSLVSHLCFPFHFFVYCIAFNSPVVGARLLSPPTSSMVAIVTAYEDCRLRTDGHANFFAPRNEGKFEDAMRRHISPLHTNSLRNGPFFGAL